MISNDTSSAPVLVFEYVTGGGWPSPSVPPDLAEEGAAMLSAVLNDFKTWGLFRTITTRDARLPAGELGADVVLPLLPEECEATLRRLLPECRAALIIAPETGGTLARLSAWVEEAGILLLGSSSNAVALAGDKWECYLRLSQEGLPTPQTMRLVDADYGRGNSGIGFPAVVKPRDGAGCDGVSLVRNERELRMLERRSKPGGQMPADEGDGSELLLQEYVPGVHASASLVVSRTRTVCLGLNRQLIDVGSRFRLRGTRFGLEHALSERAVEVACRGAAAIPGLRGYVGVDLLLTPEECFIVEINPRLTTSYVGLPREANQLLAGIWTACVGELPPTSRGSGRAGDAGVACDE